MKVAHRYGFVRAIALILKLLAWLVLLGLLALAAAAWLWGTSSMRKPDRSKPNWSATPLIFDAGPTRIGMTTNGAMINSGTIRNGLYPCKPSPRKIPARMKSLRLEVLPAVRTRLPLRSSSERLGCR